METLSPRQRLEQLVARPLPRRVRANAAQPDPPPQVRCHPIPETRLIVALEGRKEEIFAEDGVVERWSMEPGDVLLVRPDTWLAPLFHTRHRHLGLICGRDRLRVVWSRCDGHAHQAQPLVPEEWRELPFPERSSLSQAIQALSALPVSTAQETARHLMAGILLLVRDALAQPQEPQAKGERTWRQVLAWLHDNSHLPIGRAEAAQACHVSPNYLSRLCRIHRQTSFVGMLTTLRLERAATMLRTVERPIAEVAASCGFSDAGYFIRRFRRSFGQTPGAYRAARRQAG